MPLYRFVMGNILDSYDLDRADGRLAALRAAGPLVASIRDNALVAEYARELAGQLGMDIEEVRREVHRIASRRRGAARSRPTVTAPRVRGPGTTGRRPRPRSGGRRGPYCPTRTTGCSRSSGRRRSSWSRRRTCSARIATA